MNEKIDEIDNLIANGIVGSRIPEEKEEDATDFRTPEELKAIEEAKRTKVTEAVQASTVYNNLINIPGINTKELLITMVEMYMELDSKALGNPEYIDLESLNIIINAVKEYEIDSKSNGIVTNEDGSINKIESAKQLSDMSGVPVSDILVHNKVGALTSDVKLFKNDIAKSEKVYESLVTVVVDRKKAKEIYDNIVDYSLNLENLNDYYEFVENIEKFEDLGITDEFKTKDETQITGLYYELRNEKIKKIYGKELSQLKGEDLREAKKIELTEEDYKSFRERLDELDIEDKSLIEKFKDTSRWPAHKLNESFAKLERNYNEKKNFYDIQELIADKNIDLDFNKIKYTDKAKIVADICLAYKYGNKQTLANTKILLSKIEFNGMKVFEDLDKDYTKDEVINIIHAKTSFHTNVDTKEFQAIMENRGLNVKTAEERLDKIAETLKSPVQELEIGNDNKKKIYKETSKVKILKEKLFADSSKTAQRIKETQIENYLAKFDLKGKDCANAFSIKLLYAELCSREFAYEHGYRPQTHEEKLKALRPKAHGDAAAVRDFMKKRPEIFGDFRKEISEADFNIMKKMEEDNKLKGKVATTSMKKMIQEVQYIGIQSLQEDLDITKNIKEALSQVSDLKEAERKAKRSKNKKEELKHQKEIYKETISKIPKSYLNSQILIERLTRNFSIDTQVEMMTFIAECIEKEEPKVEKKLTLRETISRNYNMRKLEQERTQLEEDIARGKVPKIRPDKVTYIGLKTEEQSTQEDSKKESLAKTSKKDKDKTQTKNEIESVKQKETAQDLVNTKPKEIEKQTENRFLKFVTDAFNVAGKMGEKIVEGSKSTFENIGKFTTRLGDRIQGTGDFAPEIRENKKVKKDKSDKAVSISQKSDKETQNPEHKENDTMQKESDGYRMPENQMDSLIVNLTPEQMDARYLANHGKETQSKSVLKTTTKDDRSAEDAIVGSDDEQK